MNSYEIITDFADSEVRRKSPIDLPLCFREWLSVDIILNWKRERWNKLSRKVNTCGFPPFDIYKDWLMDFATISAGQLGRNDWRSFARQLLIHVPDCPLFCWYCFNDAWPVGETMEKRVGKSNITASKIIDEFEKAREKYPARKYNVLRITGGEPFTKPGLVKDIANELLQRYKLENNCPFLWVDTNLIPFNGKPVDEYREALIELAKLKNYCAMHICLHGVSEDSFERNSLIKYPINNIIEAIKGIIENDIKIYPRINPIGLTYEEVRRGFEILFEINNKLPAKTYLGPIEFYESVSDRICVFCGEKPIYKDTKMPPGKAIGIPTINPTNSSIFIWNELMEHYYGFGYGIIPRHLVSIKYINKNKYLLKDKWIDIILIAKSWEKEGYAQKILELLGLPNGAILNVEYENKWIDPSLVGYTFSASKYSSIIGKKVLCVAVPRTSDKQGNIMPNNIIPLRWAKIKKIIPDAVGENYSTQINIEVEEYANQSYNLFGIKNDSKEFSEFLGRNIGIYNLPFAPYNGYFCQLIGLPIRKEKYYDNKIGFKSVILDIIKVNYKNTKRDIYYCIKEIINISRSIKDIEMINSDGKLIVYEGEEIQLIIESCNPNLENEGYPKSEDTILIVESTHPELIIIEPTEIKLMKFGLSKIIIRFPYKGEFEGIIFIKPKIIDTRMAELSLPFEVKLKKEE